MALAFADDWCGTFECADQLRAAWDIWAAWELVSGSKLGVKKLAKTVVTGVEWVDGVARSPGDPLLRLNGGGHVPFLPCDRWYKHMGWLRTASADDRAAWSDESKGLRAKLRHALRRLWQVRRGALTESEFVMVSNVLLGGLAGYYLQTTFITFDEAEEIEGEWRRIFNRLFDRDFSSPRAEVYSPNFEGGQYRRHLWSMGVASLWSCIERAMAGTSSEQHAVVATSAVARALDRWGCCSDPSS